MGLVQQKCWTELSERRSGEFWSSFFNMTGCDKWSISGALVTDRVISSSGCANDKADCSIWQFGSSFSLFARIWGFESRHTSRHPEEYERLISFMISLHPSPARLSAKIGISSFVMRGVDLSSSSYFVHCAALCRSQPIAFVSNRSSADNTACCKWLFCFL